MEDKRQYKIPFLEILEIKGDVLTGSKEFDDGSSGKWDIQ